MKRSILVVIAAFTFHSLIAQSIDFAAPKKLFDHPIEGLFGFAFIPLDYNQDGLTDYIGRSTDAKLDVYLGTDNGFEILSDIGIEIFSRPYDILDFDQDGDEDIIMENYIFVYDDLTNSYDPLIVGDTLDDLVNVMGIADFDQNGFNDILTTRGSGSAHSDLSIYYYDGTSFEVEALTNDYRLGPVTIGDIDNDGDVDIAFIDKFEIASPVLLFNDGTGSFTERSVIGFQILSNRVLDLADLDGDGDLDILVRNIDNQMIIYENEDNYLTVPLTILVDNVTPISNLTADLDNDGVLEIITLSASAGQFKVDVYKGNTNLKYELVKNLATFEEPTFFLSLNPNYTQNALRLRDVGLDLDQDIVLSFPIGSDPSVYLIENFANNIIASTNFEIESFQIYPNPVSDIIEIQVDESSVYSIVNLQGQIIKSGITDESIDVTNLSNGNYLLRLLNDEKIRVSKFMVLR